MDKMIKEIDNNLENISKMLEDIAKAILCPDAYKEVPEDLEYEKYRQKGMEITFEALKDSPMPIKTLTKSLLLLITYIDDDYKTNDISKPQVIMEKVIKTTTQPYKEGDNYYTMLLRYYVI